jgi:hypothetical protein
MESRYAMTGPLSAALRQLRADNPRAAGDDGDIPVGRLPDDGARVLMNCPHGFYLTLGDRRQVRFSAGLNDVPVRSRGQVVAAHEYVIQSGATIVGNER